MIEALKGDKIGEKVGGRFKLAVLLQKRMTDVAFGAPLLGDAIKRIHKHESVSELFFLKTAAEA